MKHIGFLRFLVTFTVILTELLTCSAESSPKVCNSFGTCYIGIDKGYQTDFFEAFFGLPYAKPPVGVRRFRNPEPYVFSENGTLLNATQPKQDCIQKNYLLPTGRKVSGVEDCLYLNVYRPKEISDRKKLLPVLVYIHGGGWFSGTTNPGILGPEYFMETGKVILVTMNYRLGPFGFLSSGDDNMPGNLALKDQNLALKWIQKNIIYFKGDPNRVTIMGQSAGAVSVHMHMLSRLSRGLFHSAIALSGNAIVPFAMTEKPLKQLKNLAVLCNINNASALSTLELSRVFQSLNAEQILDCADGFKYWDVDNMVDFKAVIERKDDPEAFLIEYPEVTIKKSKYGYIPFLMTTVPGEGGVRAVAILENDTLRTGFNDNFDELFGKFLEIPNRFSAAEKRTITNQVVDQYFNGVRELNHENGKRFMDVVSHRGFQYPLLKVLESYKNRSYKYAPTVLYFNYSGPYTYTRYYTDAPKPNHYGIVHCDDLIYLFRSPLLFPDFARDSAQSAFIRFYTNFLVDFPYQQNFGKKSYCKHCKDSPKDGKVMGNFLSVTNSGNDSFELKFINNSVFEPARFWSIVDQK